MHAGIYPELPPDFGHWLAGFIDAEACFYINWDKRRGRNIQPALRVALRDDDAVIIEEIHERTRIGNISRNDWHHRRRPTNGRVIGWEVTSSADCFALIAILDRYPLRSKKARDYMIWREAVHERAKAHETPGSRIGMHGGRTPYDWTRVLALKEQLEAGRRYPG